MSSTETGTIFGYVSYEQKSAADKESIVLNEVNVDILDYIDKGTVSELQFRTMWSEFEWENKININTLFKEAGQYLFHIMKNTNMSLVGKSVAGCDSAEDQKTLLQSLESPAKDAANRKGSDMSAIDISDNAAEGGSGEDKALVAIKEKWAKCRNFPKKKEVKALRTNNSIGNMIKGFSASVAGADSNNQKSNPNQSNRQLTLEEIEQQFEEAIGLSKLIASSNFIAVNVYSKSIFGEDVLANISLEQIRDSNKNPIKLAGSIRIRSRAQGIALSLGDRVSVVQRG